MLGFYDVSYVVTDPPNFNEFADGATKFNAERPRENYVLRFSLKKLRQYSIGSVKQGRCPREIAAFLACV